MAVSYVSAGTSGTGIASSTPSYPASVAAGDLLVGIVGGKPYTSTPTLTNHTIVDGTRATSGSTANGNGTGSVVGAAFYRIATAAHSGTETAAITSGSPTMAQILRFTKGATETWDLEGYAAQDSSAGSASVATTPATMVIAQVADTPTDPDEEVLLDGTVRWQTFTAKYNGDPNNGTLTFSGTLTLGGTVNGNVQIDIRTGDPTTGTLLGQSIRPGSNPNTQTGLTNIGGNFSKGTQYYLSVRRTTSPTTGTIHTTIATGGDVYSGGRASSSATADWGGWTITSIGTVADIKAGDWLAFAIPIGDDAPTHTSQAIAVAGCTLGTVTWLTRISTTSGNDGAMYVGVVEVTAGTATGWPQYTATASATTAPAAVAAVPIVRIRAAAGTTQVTATKASSWNIVGSVTQTRTSAWRITAQVTATASAAWDVLAAVTATRDSAARVLAQVTATSASGWNIAGKVTGTVNSAYRVLAQASASSGSAWRILSQTSATRASAWAVKAQTTGSVNAAWRVAAQTTSTASSAWDILTAVTGSSSSGWRILAHVSSTRASAFRVLEAVTGSKVAAWNVLSALQQVTGSTSSAWRILAAITATRASEWHVLAQVTGTKAAAWAIKANVTQTTASAYRVLEAVTGTGNSAWRVLERVTGTRASGWNIAGEGLGVPTGLQAIAVSRTQINVSWNAVSGATGYDVERDGLIVASPAGTTYSDTGLTQGTQYSYRVRAKQVV